MKPDGNGGDNHHRSIVDAALLVAGGQPTPLFEPIDGAFPDVATRGDRLVKDKRAPRSSRTACLLIRTLRNGVRDVPLAQQPTAARVAIAFIGDEAIWPGARPLPPPDPADASDHGQVAVYGDRKPYLVALITLDPEAVKAWADEQGIASEDIATVYRDLRFRAHLDAGLARANAQLASYETVKYYEILPEDFTVENDLLTPTLKIRRRQIYARYHDLFENLYHPMKAEAAY